MMQFEEFLPCIDIIMQRRLCTAAAAAAHVEEG